MGKKAQLLCAWSGLVSIVVFFIGFWPMAHFLPPVQPAWTEERIAEFYLSNTTGIRLGSILILYAAPQLVAFYAAITLQMKRIEGELGVMSIAQIALGTLAVVPFLPAAVLLCVATFRPERDIASILILSDTVWLLLFMIAPPLMFQLLAIAYAILNDKNASPVFPRWFGFFTVWTAVLSIPGVVIVFFKTGPFAWSGLFGYWIPASLFGLWTLIMVYLLIKAIEQQEH